jgi:putative Mg2+ transporter-C (MgtC) family protein
VWQSLWETLRDEFADLSDPVQFTRIAVRLLVAIALGAIIGYERELHRKTAGLRTHMLVALGVALVIVSAEQSGVEPADMTRVLQGLFAGIGFLGAGAILKLEEKDRIKGLTTAASIWATAAIAAAAGLGRQATAVFATLLAYVILSLLLRLEQRLDRKAPPRARDDDASGSDSRD